MQNRTLANLAAADGPAARPQFTATLTPGRSLPRRVFGALLFNIAAMSYLSVMVYVILGAGPLAVLWCLDAVLCFCVYRWECAPRHLSEKVDLTEENLCITRFHPSGKMESWDFDPHWVRFEHRKCQGADDRLCLASHGREFVFGAFLTDGEKASFAAELGAALASSRNCTPKHVSGF
jgi:uncharacterized membrane protein